jgi:serine/threonine protein kinase
MAVRIESHSEPIPGYRLLDRLGAGGFGEVWKAEAPGGIFKAIKIIHGDLRSKDSDLVRYAEQELKALKRVKQVRHPYLLALDRYDIVDGRLMIVMELADCNLWDRFRECRDQNLPGIPRAELLEYMTETAEVLDLFNDQFQLQHLDIKPQNLFLLYNHVKVADFGQVKDLEGIMAQVTGGITPVYAAPETFDGIITRFCDQYSLACVYQELLTGVRPFDGASMTQLLMQHLNLPPNLSPSPPADRPALLRALAKKPEDRWPNVTSFVRALRGSGPSSERIAVPISRSLPDSASVAPAGSSESPAAPGAPLPQLVVPGDTPLPRSVSETTGPVFTPAPPETTGPGPLRPTLVVGLGQAGLRVLQRFRFELSEQFGPPAMTPLIRTLFIDTDPDALDEAQRGRPYDRLAALQPDDIFAARLNRASHYTKPRLNGRSLMEGWFDQQLLYRIPRSPITMGLRLFGRLAFCDHYRPLMGKLQAELEYALTSEAMMLTETRTGLARRTNRPCVYVVASLAGGTGGGMFLDLAYAMRCRLKRMGYEAPEIIGVFLVPPADLGCTPAQSLGNTFAALTELNHFSRDDTTFVANYDDRFGSVREKAPPFTQYYLLPSNALGLHPPIGGAGNQGTPRSRTPTSIAPPPSRLLRAPTTGSGGVPKPGSRVLQHANFQRSLDPTMAQAALKPYTDAAELIRINLTTPVGRIVDESRLAAEEGCPHPVTFAAFGLAGFDWPRSEVVARTTAKVGRTILKRWSAPDIKRMREVIPGVAQSHWTHIGLDPDTILGHLQTSADQVAGGKVDDQIALMTEPLQPRGWLARLPEAEKLALVLDRLVKLLGPPASPVKRPPTPVEQALAQAAQDAAAAAVVDIRTLLPTLVDDPQYRLAGTEEVLRQLLATTDRLMERYAQSASELDVKAQLGFECLSQYAYFQKGMRKPTAAEFADAIRQYPRARFQAVTYRQLVTVYQAVRETLSAFMLEISAARQRLEVAANLPEMEGEPTETPANPRRLMPPGCVTLADAVERFLGVVTDADLLEIDRRVQSTIEPELGGVLQACMNSATGPEDVVATVFEETRAHLDIRLGKVDLAGMFAERFRTPQQAERAIEQMYQEAEPTWVGNGPWVGGEVTILACPEGAGGEPLRELARRAIPVGGLPMAESRDSLVVYREWPSIPLAALPQLGPTAQAAYNGMSETQQCTAHTRLDVTQWMDVDAT